MPPIYIVRSAHHLTDPCVIESLSWNHNPLVAMSRLLVMMMRKFNQRNSGHRTMRGQFYSLFWKLAILETWNDCADQRIRGIRTGGRTSIVFILNKTDKIVSDNASIGNTTSVQNVRSKQQNYSIHIYWVEFSDTSGLSHLRSEKWDLKLALTSSLPIQAESWIMVSIIRALAIL